MRYFFDTEFVERASGVTLVSIGIVDWAGREYYAESESFDRAVFTNEWIEQHVVPQLTGPRKAEWEIANDLREFVIVGESWRDTEFWAYYGAYDWYLLCRIFGGMLSLPKRWPWLFHDLRLWLDRQGFAAVTQPDNESHYALSDARWNRQAFMEHDAGTSSVSPPALAVGGFG